MTAQCAVTKHNCRLSSSLTSLDIGHSELSEERIVELVAQLPRLEVLDITKAPLSDSVIEAIATHNIHLRYVCISLSDVHTS